jgi:hypothetical protein
MFTNAKGICAMSKYLALIIAAGCAAISFSMSFSLPL